MFEGVFGEPGTYHVTAANVGYDLATDSSQNLFLVGRLGGGTSTLKMDISGNILWSRVYSPGTVFADNPVIVLDSVYNVFVTASNTTSGFADYAAIKYDSSGNQNFVVLYSYLAIGSDYVSDLAINKGGVVYLTGKVQAGGGYAWATVKFSPKPTNISGNNILPFRYRLGQNYPNPYNPVTNLGFEISELPARNQNGLENFNPGGGFVSLKVYDVLGNEVAVLVNEKKNAGSYQVEFDGSSLSSGIYFYSLSVNGNLIDTKRMLLLK